nr:hypothetical protein [Tanacetum cinerariifolium]
MHQHHRTTTSSRLPRPRRHHHLDLPPPSSPSSPSAPPHLMPTAIPTTDRVRLVFITPKWCVLLWSSALR